MPAMTGDRLRNNLTGTMYRVKVIKGRLVVLETEDGSCQMLTEKDSIKLFYGEEVYAFRFILVGKPSYIDSHPHEVRRVLRALIAANQEIRANPVEARRAVGDAVKIDDATMAKLFEPEDYAVSLDQAMLLALDDQARWAMQKGLVARRPMPNYLDFMKYQDLEAVLPTAVTIVH